MLTRREFLRLTSSSALLGSWPSASFRETSVAEARTLRLGLILPAAGGVLSQSSKDLSAGAALALSETQRAGELFGQRIKLIERRIASPRDLERSARSLAGDARVAVIIGGMSNDESRALSRAAEQQAVLFFNVGGTADLLRGAECRRHTFHVAASDAMIGAAKAAAGSSGEGPPRIELWHESLERYGASQLNDRFRARAGRPMKSSAWAGWAAVKISWEASLRARGVIPEAMLAVLENDATQFDGHKGTPISFRTWDHQLRQPLYAVSGEENGGRVVAELPDVGRSTNQSMRAELDRFPGARGESMCGDAKR